MIFEHDLKTLATLRKLVADTNEQMQESRKRLQDTPEYKRIEEIQTCLSEYQSKVTEYENFIKTDGVKLATEKFTGLTGEEKEKAISEFRQSLINGTSLRINHTLKYEINQITDWCKENAKLLFKLDVKEFEKMADKVDVPGVEKIDVPTITIASDLSEYLK